MRNHLSDSSSYRRLPFFTLLHLPLFQQCICAYKSEALVLRFLHHECSFIRRYSTRSPQLRVFVIDCFDYDLGSSAMNGSGAQSCPGVLIRQPPRKFSLSVEKFYYYNGCSYYNHRDLNFFAFHFSGPCEG